MEMTAKEHEKLTEEFRHYSLSNLQTVEDGVEDILDTCPAYERPYWRTYLRIVRETITEYCL